MLDKNTVINLNLYDVVKAFGLNDEQCAYVTEVLCDMGQTPAEVKKKQDCVQDFIAAPTLIPDCRKALSELEHIMKQRTALKRASFQVRSSYEADQRRKTRTIFGNLSDISKNLLLLIRLYVNMNGVLGKYDFRSEYMNDMKAFFHRYTSGESFRNFGNTINKFSHIEEGNSHICMNVSLGEEVGSIAVGFVSVNEEARIPGIRASETGDADMINRLTGMAVKDLCDYLNNIAESMENKLADIFRQLMFYSFAVNYVEVLKQQKLPVSYPELTGDYQKTCFKNLYSLHLVAKNIQPIVPHNVDLSELTVIYGVNNAGKTCYLRGVALAHVFAQAGLPLPMEAGSLCPVSDILSQFAVGEKDLGRFEEELKAVSGILDKVGTGTLIIFNETFQSTVYEEIAQPYMDILDAMAEAGGHVMVVNHNQVFIDLCRERMNINLLRINESHGFSEGELKK